MYQYKGNYSYYLEKRQERIEAKSVEIERANNLYRTELDWMRRMPQARAHKAKYRQDAFYEIEKVAKQRFNNDNVKLDVKASYIGSKIFEADHLYKSFGDLKILDDFSYIFARYEKMGIVGNNGTGKSTFIKILMGEVQPDSGTVDIGETVRFGYYSQDGLQFDEQMKVIDVVQDIAEVIELGNGKKLTASQFLQHFLFTPETQHSYVYKLSGGERRRLYLCTVLMRNPNFLVLDEPTNDLDIGTLTILEDYLDHFQGIVITVSHDRYFLDRVVRRIFAFEGGGAIRQYEGGYTDYQAACGERIAAEMEASGTASGQERGRGQKTGGASGAGTSDAAETAKDKNRGRQREKKLKFSYMEQKEWETIEDDIAALEEAIADLEQQMQDSARDYTALNGIIKEKEEKEALLEEKMDRWMYLNDLAEKIEAQAGAHK